jgi:hypothetical protein
VRMPPLGASRPGTIARGDGGRAAALRLAGNGWYRPSGCRHSRQLDRGDGRVDWVGVCGLAAGPRLARSAGTPRPDAATRGNSTGAMAECGAPPDDAPTCREWLVSSIRMPPLEATRPGAMGESGAPACGAHTCPDWSVLHVRMPPLGASRRGTIAWGDGGRAAALRLAGNGWYLLSGCRHSRQLDRGRWASPARRPAAPRLAAIGGYSRAGCRHSRQLDRGRPSRPNAATAEAP